MKKLLLLSILLTGCCKEQFVERVRIDTVTVNVPYYIHDTITAYLQPDSSFWGSDTVVTIQFKDRIFKYWIHDTVKTKYIDTTYVKEVVTIEKTGWEKVVLWVSPYLVGALLILLVVVWIRK